MKKHIEVVAAILTFEKRYLAVQRGPAKLDYISHKWEFPGGKVEKGESLEEAISRELQEELAITITDPQLLITVEHSYPDFDITMHCFVVAVQSPEIVLTEHIAQRWLEKEHLMDVDWAEADIPAVHKLMSQ
ncbi:DNA mismatch repair protein MutT [Enterovibrio norvegicus FF-162]|uniref:(deoxy)nucleoside triphosphate pyrophosphohydrolase n=1 Tax=Enterovibrio norvegicus TaxID=188144 RepID=UPI0002E833C7|nr:(deoxy)nucleoside triphosphate pyrophosphohydrolase [Enterovibrio norvegicus]OEE89423.1 DNA mismatch repair protein MutT [Enterovibrio norvegicus FF-162]